MTLKFKAQRPFGKSRRLLFVTSLATAGLPAAALATNPSHVFFDFNDQTVYIYGVSRADSESTRNGLTAEMEARADGVAKYQEFVRTECAKPAELKESEWMNRPLQSWRSELRSKGSEIYPDSILKIQLAADIQTLYPRLLNTKRADARTADGKRIIFTVPVLSAAHTSCGVPSLQVTRDKAVKVVPLRTSANNQNTVIIDLVLDKSGVLTPSTDAERALLETSTLATAGDLEGLTSPLSIPIVVPR